MTDDLGRFHQRSLYRLAALGAVLLVAVTAGAVIHGRHESKTRGVQLLLNQAACSWEAPGVSGVPMAPGVWWGRTVPAATIDAVRTFNWTAKEAPALGARVAIIGGGHAGVCSQFGAAQVHAFTAFQTLYP